VAHVIALYATVAVVSTPLEAVVEAIVGVYPLLLPLIFLYPTVVVAVAARAHLAWRAIATALLTVLQYLLRVLLIRVSFLAHFSSPYPSRVLLLWFFDKFLTELFGSKNTHNNFGSVLLYISHSTVPLVFNPLKRLHLKQTSHVKLHT
jgi:hypothetical protein